MKSYQVMLYPCLVAAQEKTKINLTKSHKPCHSNLVLFLFTPETVVSKRPTNTCVHLPHIMLMSPCFLRYHTDEMANA